jgi:hypothetical protein
LTDERRPEKKMEKKIGEEEGRPAKKKRENRQWRRRLKEKEDRATEAGHQECSGGVTAYNAVILLRVVQKLRYTS